MQPRQRHNTAARASSAQSGPLVGLIAVTVLFFAMVGFFNARRPTICSPVAGDCSAPGICNEVLLSCKTEPEHRGFLPESQEAMPPGSEAPVSVFAHRVYDVGNFSSGNPQSFGDVAEWIKTNPILSNGTSIAPVLEWFLLQAKLTSATAVVPRVISDGEWFDLQLGHKEKKAFRDRLDELARHPKVRGIVIAAVHSDQSDGLVRQVTEAFRKCGKPVIVSYNQLDEADALLKFGELIRTIQLGGR